MAHEVDIKIKLLDRRTASRYLARGKLNERDYEKHLKSLPDLAGNIAPVEAAHPGDAPAAEPTSQG